MLDKGVLVISQEIEMAWGVYPNLTKISNKGLIERETLIRLLDIYKKYNVRITWDIVGHLFFNECDGKCLENYPKELLKYDPGTTILEDPIWYGKDMVDLILKNNQKHEIAAHSFSHVPFNSCSVEIAENEIRKCREIANKLNINMRSFVFPYNSIGHLDILEKYGFEAIRADNVLFDDDKNINFYSKVYKKFAYDKKSILFKIYWKVAKTLRKINILFNIYPIKLSEPRKLLNNLYLIPMSSSFPMYDNKSKMSKFFNGLELYNVKKAIDIASENKKVIHLWCHIHDYKNEEDFKNLEEILQHASKKRSENRLIILPMCDTVDEYKK